MKGISYQFMLGYDLFAYIQCYKNCLSNLFSSFPGRAEMMKKAAVA